MANLSVSYQDLNTSADKLVAGRDDINQQLTSLQSQIAALVSSGFVTDRTSGAFKASYETFTKGARDTISGLDGLSAFLRQTATTLADVDTQLAARLSR